MQEKEQTKKKQRRRGLPCACAFASVVLLSLTAHDGALNDWAKRGCWEKREEQKKKQKTRSCEREQKQSPDA